LGRPAKLRSQFWRGGPWDHDVSWHEPSSLGLAPRTGLLYVTGGPVNPVDQDTLDLLAESLRLPVVGLFQIPVQPLLGDLWEDDLIAQTFVEFLASGEPDWPLLGPMVRSVFAAIHLLQGRVDQWIITGGSKRGWTSWLAGCTGDPRIVGIAPMVFDQLNARAQIRAQIDSWGTPSPMIEPYIARGLARALETPSGQRLAALVDPFTTLGNLKCPVLMVHGANDPYWTVDALGRYWDSIPGSKAVRIVPNQGHNISDGRDAAPVLAAFARALCRGEPWPEIRWEREGTRVKASTSVPSLAGRVWRARGLDAPFSDRLWTSEPLESGLLEWGLDPGTPEMPTASFLELDFAGGASLTTQAFRSPDTSYIID